MKKIIAGAILATACFSANAAQCIVNMKNGTSYIRNQTSCVTTQYAGGNNIGKLATAVVVAGAVLWFLKYINEESNNLASTADEIVASKNYSMVTCTLRKKNDYLNRKADVNLLLGERKGVGTVGNSKNQDLFKVDSRGYYVYEEDGNYMIFDPKAMDMTLMGPRVQKAGGFESSCKLVDKV